MKRLILFRHAKTERDSPSGEDFDRQLTREGREAATRMGAEMRARSMARSHVLVSPAKRAVETAELASLPAELNEKIYNASVEELLAIIRSEPDSSDGLTLVGHNPGLEQLASQLARTPVSMPTGSVAELNLPVNSWTDVDQADGELVRFITPADLA